MLKKRAFCRGSLFLVKIAKKVRQILFKTDLKTPKIPKKRYKTNQNLLFISKMNKK